MKAQLQFRKRLAPRRPSPSCCGHSWKCTNRTARAINPVNLSTCFPLGKGQPRNTFRTRAVLCSNSWNIFSLQIISNECSFSLSLRGSLGFPVNLHRSIWPYLVLHNFLVTSLQENTTEVTRGLAILQCQQCQPSLWIPPSDTESGH